MVCGRHTAAAYSSDPTAAHLQGFPEICSSSAGGAIPFSDHLHAAGPPFPQEMLWVQLSLGEAGTLLMEVWSRQSVAKSQHGSTRPWGGLCLCKSLTTQ